MHREITTRTCLIFAEIGSQLARLNLIDKSARLSTKRGKTSTWHREAVFFFPVTRDGTVAGGRYGRKAIEGKRSLLGSGAFNAIQ